MQLALDPTVTPGSLEPLSPTGDHPAVEAWTAFAAEPVLPVVEVLKYKNKSKVFRLRRPGGNSPGVIAKWCCLETAARERFIYDEFLSQLPGPVLHCYGTSVQSNRGFTWLFLEEATGRRYLPEERADRRLAGRWLAIVHSLPLASRPDLTAALPDRTPDYYLRVLRAARELLREHLINPFVLADDSSAFQSIIGQCDFLEAHWSQLSERCDAAPRVLVHGDLVEKNVRVQQASDGPALLVFDWENAGWGVAATDLAHRGDRAIVPDPNTYLESLTMKLSRSVLRRVAECGRVFRLLDCIHWAAVTLVYRSYEWISTPCSCLRVYGGVLTEAMRPFGRSSRRSLSDRITHLPHLK